MLCEPQQLKAKLQWSTSGFEAQLAGAEEVEPAIAGFLERMCRLWTLDCNFNEELCLRLLATCNFSRKQAFAALQKKDRVVLRLVSESKT